MINDECYIRLNDGFATKQKLKIHAADYLLYA